MLVSRPRSAADCAELIGWIPDAEALHLLAGPSLAWPLTADQLLDMEHADGFSAWSGVDPHSSELLGHFDLTLAAGGARLGRVAVSPEHRGRGLAHELVRLAVHRAAERGATELKLNVIRGNTPAIRAYRRAGFRPVASPDRPDVIPMALPL